MCTSGSKWFRTITKKQFKVSTNFHRSQFFYSSSQIKKNNCHLSVIRLHVLSSFPCYSLENYFFIFLFEWKSSAFSLKPSVKPSSGLVKICREELRERAKAALLTHHLRERRGLHIQHYWAFLYTRPQLKQAVQGQGGHVRFAPSLPTLFYLLLKLDPPRRGQSNENVLKLLGPCRHTSQRSETAEPSRHTDKVKHTHFPPTFPRPQIHDQVAKA